MQARELHRRLTSLERMRGAVARDLSFGDAALRLEGLDPELAERLERRWGGFLGPPTAARPLLTLRVYDAGSQGWLGAARRGEPYRLEAFDDGARHVVASYNFAICPEQDDPACWRVGLTGGSSEPEDRMFDNATRYMAARGALAAGGFALHAAGVLRNNRAFLLAGPSRAGKSTASRLLAETPGLGDDFAVVLPRGGDWAAPALPFDNSERVVGDPPRGLFPLAGIWRLHQAPRTWVERPPAAVASASLLGCVAFPWVLAEMKDTLIDRVRKFVAEGRFAHLHFHRDADLWRQLLGPADPPQGGDRGGG